jgi:hypothetical protein
MKRMIIGGAAIVLAVTPAVIGLWSNPSFSATVPVRVPASGQIVLPTPSPSASDDHGGDTPRDQRTEPGDDRDANGGTPSPSPSPSATRGDDHGGDTPRDQRTEPGDDRRSGGDRGGHGGDDDRSGHGGGKGSDDGRHGGDDRAGDDHGGHGGDD